MNSDGQREGRRRERRKTASGSSACAAAVLLLQLGATGAACGGGSLGGAPVSDGNGHGGGHAAARAAMVETQIRARGVKDPRVLEAMGRVERHRFVPADLASRAYDDHPLPIGWEQTISQPYIVAVMSELLELDGSERVLEIGTGSGYQAAVLGELAREVHTIEIVEPLAAQAAARLAELGYENVHVRAGDGYRGWPEAAPFDAVILTAAPPEIPPPLVEQLAPGGVLVAPVGDVQQELLVVRKTADGLERRAVIPVRFVPMTGEARDGE